MKRLLILAIGTAIALAIAVGGYLFWQQENAAPDTKEEAIRQAEEYKPEGVCTQALVPAVHPATGARYTFGTGCLPPGWVGEQSPGVQSK